MSLYNMHREMAMIYWIFRELCRVKVEKNNKENQEFNQIIRLKYHPFLAYFNLA